MINLTGRALTSTQINAGIPPLTDELHSKIKALSTVDSVLSKDELEEKAIELADIAETIFRNCGEIFDCSIVLIDCSPCLSNMLENHLAQAGFSVRFVINSDNLEYVGYMPMY